MFLVVKRKVFKWWTKAPWLTIWVFLGCIYWVGYAMMLWQEPAANPIRNLATYSYFFVITVTTTGYGDIVPITLGGRLTASGIAISGIGAAAVVLSNLFNMIGTLGRRRMTGLGEYEMKNHIVIFGNRGGETAALIKELIADQQSSGTEIVLCSQTTEKNPFPDFIEFVRGEMTSADVAERACVKHAAKVIIHAGTDYESICIALAVKEINATAPIVVKANDPGQEVNIERVDRQRVVCVKPVEVAMIVREIHNPGITQVLEHLLSAEGQDLRSIQAPVGGPTLLFGLLAHTFREQYGAILIGMRPAGKAINAGSILNPSFHSAVEGGMFLDYISRKPVRVDWQKVFDQQAKEAV
jgi:voltage-gated potassium channel